MQKEINFYSRSGEYGWLSNFYRSMQFIEGKMYETNEHFYQSRKAKDPEIQSWIRTAPNPFLAMKAGRSVRLGKELVDGWGSKKVYVMLLGLRAKFNQNPVLKQKLLDTNDAILYEDSPTDMFWGKKGQNMLGKLLMQVRDEFRK